MKKKITILSVPLFFIVPWISFLLSLIRPKSKSTAVVYILFAAFYGYSFSFSNPSIDSYRYATAFINFERPGNYLSIIQMYLDGQLRDIYRPSLFYWTSFFSNSPNVLFAMAGLLYGVISYLNLRIYSNEQGNLVNLYTIILIILFITFCSLSHINGFRFNTGGMLAFYLIYKLMIENKRIWGLGLFILPLIHYSFILFVPVVLFLKLILPLSYNSDNIKPLVFYIFIISFISSFFLSSSFIDISFFTQSSLLPSAAADRMDFLTSDDIPDLMDQRKSDSLYLKVESFYGYLISIYVLIVVIRIKGLLASASGNLTEINRLFSFVLLYFSFAYLASSFFSGGRFLEIAHMFLVILLVRIYSLYNSNKIKKLIILSILPYSIKILFVNIYLPIMTLTPTFWYGGFLGVLLENLNAIR